MEAPQEIFLAHISVWHGSENAKLYMQFKMKIIEQELFVKIFKKLKGIIKTYINNFQTFK